jgi:hypothetical protein
MSTQPNQQYSPGTQQSSEAGGGDSLVGLVRQLAQQGSHLAEQQLQLIQAEVRESANDVKVAVGGLLGAAVAGIAGLGVLLMGISYLLGDAIDNTPLATLIVGVVTLIVAFILYSSAKKKMDAAHLSPERSRRTLERTPDAVRGDLTPGA